MTAQSPEAYVKIPTWLNHWVISFSLAMVLSVSGWALITLWQMNQTITKLSSEVGSQKVASDLINTRLDRELIGVKAWQDLVHNNEVDHQRFIDVLDKMLTRINEDERKIIILEQHRK